MPFRIFEDEAMVLETTNVNKVIEFIDKSDKDWNVKMMLVRENDTKS